ncbi:MAG: hypothetical protein JW940_26360 [Polyangiaceae bacterium]|nr:hypothetical protein [Polyangiaceae bacterium]
MEQLIQYPVAVDMDPVPASSEHGTPRSEVFLALRMPPQNDPIPSLHVVGRAPRLDRIEG